MIIGIDESGGFEDKEISIFVSVFIRPTKLNAIEQKFKTWENSLPEAVKDRDEVKGNLLSEEQLETFVETIIIQEDIPYSCFGIVLDDNNLIALRKQKNLIQKRTNEAVGFYRFRGEKFKGSAKDYLRLFKWSRKLKIKNLGKITLLGFTITESLNNAIIVSALGGFDRELGDLSFRIDRDFIPDEKEILWKDLVRNQIYHYSSFNPIIEIAEWDENHPFKKTFQADPKSKDNVSVLSKEFKKRIKFYDSKNEVAIRIADITAVILRRYINEKKHAELYEKLKAKKFPLKKGSCQLLVLKKDGRKVKNPYNYSWIYLYRVIIFIKKLLSINER